MRPCIILQNDLISQYLGVYLVAPITGNLTEVPTGLILDDWKSYGLDASSKILFHQIRVIDETRIIKPLGVIGDLEIKRQIEEKIRLTFAL